MKQKNLEIERKFLVDHDLLNKSSYRLYTPTTIRQGYMSEDEDKLIRIRTNDNLGFITIKGEGLLSHKEYEYSIPFSDALEMLNLYCPNKITKVRHKLPYKNHIWEVDIFYDKNDGLILAEIELESENEEFEKPEWIKEEVTGDIKYYNNNLAKYPFKTWGR